jgi:hypothetical protein
MAKLPSFRRIAADVLAKDYPDLAELMIVPLNNFMESVTRALNKQLTFSDNMDAQVITFTSDGTFPVKLRWDRPSKPIALWIGQITRVDGATVGLSTAVTLEWTYTGQIEILDTVGLTSSSTDQHQVTIIGAAG